MDYNDYYIVQAQELKTTGVADFTINIWFILSQLYYIYTIKDFITQKNKKKKLKINLDYLEKNKLYDIAYALGIFSSG